MPYCINCGSQITTEMLYCPKCGRRLLMPTVETKVSKTPGPATDQGVSKQETIVDHGIRKGKLYKEWVQYAGLHAPEAPPIRRERGLPHRSLRFYILFSVGILVCIGLIIFLIRIW